MTLLARCSIHLPQALAEALTSSKAILGRRLLQCSDLSKCIKVGLIRECVGFEGPCNAIVSRITATWSAAVKVANDATKAVRKAADVAAAAATKAFNEMKDKLEEAAKAAAAAATKTLNEVKDAAEKAAATATKFIDDVKNAFSELGEEIQCAAPLPPEGRAPAVVARQWPHTPPAPLRGILAQRADVWNPVALGRSVFDGVEQLVLDVGAFAVKLGNDLVDFVNKLPSPKELMQLAIDGIKKKLFKENGLCLAPSCPGYHINSGVEQDLVPGLDDLEILARSPTHIISRPRNALESTTHLADAYIALSDHKPSIVTPIATDHTPEAASSVVRCGRRSPRCPFASTCTTLGSMLPA